ncbi:hypothetical protein [Agrobacterium sp. NPDC089420]|uniref:hypothetical protein n=1 Tax=Agrobacterium sp. NPDC089420 TaxID=3363918 RepID=UPI00385056C4
MNVDVAMLARVLVPADRFSVAAEEAVVVEYVVQSADKGVYFSSGWKWETSSLGGEALFLTGPV